MVTEKAAQLVPCLACKGIVNFYLADAVRVAGVLLLFCSFVGAEAIVSRANATELVREPASICSPFSTSSCDERAIRVKAIEVADNGESRGPGLVERIISAISVYRDEEEKGSARVEALSRDSSSKSLMIPILAASTRQSMIAGSRQFHITWVGGKPPFAVELVGPSGSTVARWPQTAEHRVAATVSLEEGFYELRVTDASGEPALGAFEATSQRPTVDGRGLEQLPADLGAALLAARLADIDGGSWQLEAYERLTAEPNGDAARIIANRLAYGLSVSELREQGAPRR